MPEEEDLNVSLRKEKAKGCSKEFPPGRTESVHFVQKPVAVKKKRKTGGREGGEGWPSGETSYPEKGLKKSGSQRLNKGPKESRKNERGGGDGLKGREREQKDSNSRRPKRGGRKVAFLKTQQAQYGGKERETRLREGKGRIQAVALQRPKWSLLQQCHLSVHQMGEKGRHIKGVGKAEVEGNLFAKKTKGGKGGRMKHERRRTA